MVSDLASTALSASVPASSSSPSIAVGRGCSSRRPGSHRMPFVHALHLSWPLPAWRLHGMRSFVVSEVTLVTPETEKSDIFPQTRALFSPLSPNPFSDIGPYTSAWCPFTIPLVLIPFPLPSLVVQMGLSPVSLDSLRAPDDFFPLPASDAHQRRRLLDMHPDGLFGPSRASFLCGSS